jgi:hypothetical protein
LSCTLHRRYTCLMNTDKRAYRGIPLPLSSCLPFCLPVGHYAPRNMGTKGVPYRNSLARPMFFELGTDVCGIAFEGWRHYGDEREADSQKLSEGSTFYGHFSDATGYAPTPPLGLCHACYLHCPTIASHIKAPSTPPQAVPASFPRVVP